VQTPRDEQTQDDLFEGVGSPDAVPESRSGRREHRPDREHRRNRKVLVAALVLLLLPVLAVGGYLVWLNQIVTNNVQQEDLLPGVGAMPTDSAGATVAQPVGNGTNYLIIGNDAGPDRVGARSDVMVLVHVPEDRAKVQLVHFPRDLWVSIPDRGKAKLNAAYAYGGAPLLVRTMQNMLGITIDHVAMLGFEDFKNITDAVGGVDVQVEEASQGDGKVFRKGVQHMDGETALVFVRQRYMLSEGDISRGKRQMAFIEALMQKTLSADTLTNPLRLKDFIAAATDNLTVDRGLDVGTMRGEAFAMRNLRPGDIVRITAPFTGFGTSPDGQSIDIVDEARMKQLGEALRTDTMDSYN
jgi:LCP family protein required for cell wall assembly